jgi:hypothetical protein
MKEVRMAVLGANQRIYALTEPYNGPPGPILSVTKPEADERGEYQLIRYFYGITIRVPPLHLWPPGWAINRPDPRAREPLLVVNPRSPRERLEATPTPEPETTTSF